MTVPGQTAVARRGFNLALPDGFIELPVDEDDFGSPGVGQDLIAKVAALFDLRQDSDHAVAAAAAVAAIGTTAGAGGLDYSAVAFYKSPDDPMRPILIALSGTTMPSDHHSRQAAVEGLEIHESRGRGVPATLQLPAGAAVVVIAEEENSLAFGDMAVPILTRQASLWVPDPDGTTMGMVTVQTSSWQDWERVCVVALDIFDSFEWQPLDDC